MFDALRGLVDRLRPTPADFPEPPHAFTDDDGRTITFRAYPDTPPSAEPPRTDTSPSAEPPRTDTSPSAEPPRTVRTYDALVEMYVDFDPSMRAQGTPPAGEEAVREWLDRIATGPGVVARHRDRVVGHVAFVPDGSGRHELAVYVHQDYQGAHVGTELVRTGLGHAKSQGVTAVWLSVESGNRNAQRLYANVGFTTDAPLGQTYRMSRTL